MDSVFSPIETEVLKIIKSAKKPQKISEVAAKFFAGKKVPLDPNATISGAVLNINKKCAFKKLKFKIASEGLGRGGKTVWFEGEA